MITENRQTKEIELDGNPREGLTLHEVIDNMPNVLGRRFTQGAILGIKLHGGGRVEVCNTSFGLDYDQVVAFLLAQICGMMEDSDYFPTDGNLVFAQQFIRNIAKKLGVKIDAE